VVAEGRSPCRATERGSTCRTVRVAAGSMSILGVVKTAAI
jgi:hypothetical protein